MTNEASRVLTDEHYIAIAKVITAWSALEQTLRFLACALTSGHQIDDETARISFIAFNGMQARTLVGVIQSLVQARFPEHEQKFKKYGEKVLSAKTQRDVMAHSVFIAGAQPNSIQPLSAKTVGGLKMAMGEWVIADLVTWEATIYQLNIQALAFLKAWDYLEIPDSGT